MLLQSKSMNYWPETRCAKAFWNQYELPPYQELLRDTAALVEPAAGQRDHRLDVLFRIADVDEGAGHGRRAGSRLINPLHAHEHRVPRDARRGVHWPHQPGGWRGTLR